MKCNRCDQQVKPDDATYNGYLVLCKKCAKEQMQ